MKALYYRTLTTCVTALRTGHEGIAAQNLAWLLDMIHEELSVGRFPPGPGILTCVNDALARQERHDFIGLADVLEFELTPMIKQLHVN